MTRRLRWADKAALDHACATVCSEGRFVTLLHRTIAQPSHLSSLYQVYARTLVELISRRAPTAGPLLLAISIREHSSEMFRGVMRVCEEQRVW